MHQQTTCPAGASACTPGNCPIKCPALHTQADASGDDAAKQSHRLFAWLSDDGKREQLYRCMIHHKQPLPFQSRVQVAPVDANNYLHAQSFHRVAYLLVHREHLEIAYQQSLPAGARPNFSNQPFQELGGSFMLAMDELTPPPAESFEQHTGQRDYCYAYLETLKQHFDPIATVAFKTGALLPLKSRNFDLAELAQQVAIRYVAMLFGYSLADLPMLDQAGAAVGEGLQYQMMARHFVTKPSALLASTAAFGQLVQRSAELIDLYDAPIGKQQRDARRDLIDELDKLKAIWFEDPVVRTAERQQRLADFSPLMLMMAEDNSSFSTTEKAILVAGLVGGAITNIRASICIALQQFFRVPQQLPTIQRSAFDAYAVHRDANWGSAEDASFRRYVEEAMRINPPAPFLPRVATTDISLRATEGQAAYIIPAGSLILLGVGGGSWVSTHDDTPIQSPEGRFQVPSPTPTPAPNGPAPACPFHMVFGGRPDLKLPGGKAQYTHSCFGMDLAMYVVSYTVRQLMLLPGLTQSLDPLTGCPWGLIKHWGSFCDSYPLEYERGQLLRQSPLQTVLQIKSPVSVYAENLKTILKYGAPFIEKVLMDSKTIHFASFVFLENDSKLALFTAYDGDYEAYIAHFAREFGPLFDQFFSCMEVQPPMPIRKHAFEFVQYLRQFQQPSVGDYFYSAYPLATADQIGWRFNPERELDLFTLYRTAT